MKPTNYHLFDFLDFDPDLSRDESLWKAYKPTSVYEKDGDICINVPFQKQVLSNDMAPDTAFPREEYTLVIRQYTSGITRLFIGFGEESMTDQSIIRKTKCFDFWERNVLFPKTKRSFFRTPTPLPCPFPLNFSLLIITKKFGNLAKNRYICIV